MTSLERQNIRDMAGYTWGEQPDDGKAVKLNTNENPYPPSPKVDEVLARLTAASLRQYPNPTAVPLRKLVASQHGLHMDQVVMTHGGDEALRLAITTFVDSGAGFGIADPSYSLYPVLAAVQNAQVVRVPLMEDWLPPADLAQQLNAAGCRLTCLVNPHAPSGALISLQVLRTVAEELAGVLLIDEAYADFVDPEVDYRSTTLVREYENVLILRSFSKGYGLAGMRLGYLLGAPSLIDPILNKTRDSYNIDHISQQVGYAALADQTYAAQTWRKVRDERTRLAQALALLGLPSPASQANFLLVQAGQNSVLDADEIYQQLKSRGILVRYFSAPRLRDKLRISVGTVEENNQLIEHLTDLLTA